MLWRLKLMQKLMWLLVLLVMLLRALKGIKRLYRIIMKLPVKFTTRTGECWVTTDRSISHISEGLPLNKKDWEGKTCSSC
jgi:hypothetical protein